MATGGQLEPALVQYKRSLERGIDRAELNIRNVRLIMSLCFPCSQPANLEGQVSAKIFGQRMKAAADNKEVKEES